MAGDLQELPGGHVTEYGAGWRQLVEGGDLYTRLDRSAKRPQIRGQRLRDSLRATARQWPANEVSKHAEEETESGARQPFERYDGMRCQTGEKTARGFTGKPVFRQRPRRAQAAQAESQQCQRVAWRSQRPEQGLFEHTPGGHQRCHELPIRRGILPKRLACHLYRALEEGCRSVVERVGQRYRRVNPFHPVLVQREAAEEGGHDRQGMNRRAHIVDKARQREGGRSDPTADALSSFIDED